MSTLINILAVIGGGVVCTVAVLFVVAVPDGVLPNGDDAQ